MKPLIVLFLLAFTLTPQGFGQTSKYPVERSDDAPSPSATTSPTIKFLPRVEASRELVGAEDDVFFASLFPREAAAMTATPRGDKTVEESRIAARASFGNAVLEFDEAERAMLTAVVESIVRQFQDRYPLLVDRPWKFIKTKRDLCGGFSFTRGDCIVLSESTLAQALRLPRDPSGSVSPVESLLLHEQMHVLERFRPELFVSLFEDIFGFHAASVKVHPWIDERQVTNPDGISDDWVIKIKSDGGESRYFWLGTLLLKDKPLHTMGGDFTSVAVPVSEQTDGSFEMSVDVSNRPVFLELSQVSQFTSRLPIPGGFDHPNEVAAYLFTEITHGTSKPNGEEAARVMSEAAEWFLINLQVPKDASEESPNGK